MEPYQATLFRELGTAGVSYVLCGGLAIVLHGLHRFTADIDLAVALDAENLHRFIEVASRLGYRPRAPVPAADLVDPANRRHWQREKGKQKIQPPRPQDALDILMLEKKLGEKESP